MITKKYRSFDNAFVFTKNDVDRLERIFAELEATNCETIESKYEEEKRQRIREAQLEKDTELTTEEIERIGYFPTEMKESALNGLGRRWTIYCSDYTEIITDEIDDLLNFPNSTIRQIEGLKINTRNYNYLNGDVNFEFREHSSISYSLEGPDEKVLFFSKKIEELIHGSRPWYSILTRLDAWFSVLVGYGLFGLAYFVAVIFFRPGGGENSLKLTIDLPNYLFFIIAISPIIVGFLLIVVQKIFFPRVIFALGAGAALARSYEKRRNMLGIGFVLSALASVLANLVS